MPKMKTNSSAKKRFKVTGSGKLKRKKAFRNHLLKHKPPKRKRHLRHDAVVDSSDEKRMLRLLGMR